jgi:hypothetical protein
MYVYVCVYVCVCVFYPYHLCQYCESKAEGEQLLLAAMEKHPDFKAIILRLPGEAECMCVCVCVCVCVVCVCVCVCVCLCVCVCVCVCVLLSVPSYRDHVSAFLQRVVCL